MTLFTASFETVFIRFVLMMATVIGSFTLGVPILAILALPIFLSALTAVSFKKETTKKQSKLSAHKSVRKLSDAA